MNKTNKNINFNYAKPLLIAEISGNHNGSKKRFLKLVESACKNGADLVKIQTYEPIDITLKSKHEKFRIKKGLWKNYYLWDLYKKAHTPFSWHKSAFKIAKKYKKHIFSSPFSNRGVDLLERLNVEIYKIASFEITDMKLINYIASKKKPIIISTGMATIKEIKNAIKEINKFHKKIVILHCVSEYPTKLEDTNLKRIQYLKKIFKNYKIGLSDHTNNIHSSVASHSYGVVVLEKHFNLDKKKTPDSDFSILPSQLYELSQVIKGLSKSIKDKKSKNGNLLELRRSIFSSENIKKNQTINNNNISTLRPKIGICASKYFEIIGRKAKKDIKKNSPIFFKNLI